jgi:uncharacterized membrane protein YfhO
MLLILIFSVAFAVFYKYLTLENLYLFKDIGSDTVNTFLPRIVHAADYWRSEGIPRWSFNQGMGQNIYAKNLGNPFEWILFVLGRNNLVYGIAYVEVLKILLGGTFFFLYLRTLSLTPFVAIVGGLLFSFSSFMILGGGWYQFSVQAVYMALLLYAFERYFIKGSWVLFPIPVALIGASSPFHLYTAAMFILVYGAFRHIDANGWKPKELGVFYLKLVGLGLLGIALSSIFMFGNLLDMIESPRVSGKASYVNRLSSHSLFGVEGIMHNVTAILRFYSDNILGAGSKFRGWQNYLEAPMVYCGLISLLLAPQVFAYLDRRRKILYGVFALLFILPIMFPYFRYAFWLFTGDYYRIFSLFVSLVLLFYGMQALSRIDDSRKVNLIFHIGALLVLVVILYYCSTISPINKGLRNIAFVFLLIYAVLIYLLSFSKTKLISQLLLIGVICVEVGYFSYITTNDRSVVTAKEYKEKTGYNDYSMDATAFLNARDHSFFRVEKGYASGPSNYSSLNDGKMQHYFGTSSYNSFNQINYINFLAGTNVIDGSDEYQTRWARGLIGRPLLLSFASVKYVLSKREHPPLVGNTYTILTKFGDVTVLENKNYLPFGFTYDHYISSADFKKLHPQDKGIALINAFVADESILDKLQGFVRDKPETFMGKAPSYSFKNYTDDVNSRKKTTLNIVEHDQNHFKGDIALNDKKLLFFSIPFDRGWSAKVDGKPAQLIRVNIGFTGLVLGEGRHHVELEFTPPYAVAGLVVTLIAMLGYINLLRRDSRRCRRRPEGGPPELQQ